VGTAISAEPDGIVTETTNFNSNATTPPFISPITQLGNRSEYFRHFVILATSARYSKQRDVTNFEEYNYDKLVPFPGARHQ
jgi:hypothetical protein